MLAVRPNSSETAKRRPPTLVEMPTPEPGRGEVRLAVRATALNRADLLQMRGLYPPPAGESKIPGLECSGVVEAVGPEARGWQPGDHAMALLAGGGHAEQVVVPTGQLMAMPADMDFAAAAALPEVALTAWTNLVAEGELVRGESVLVVAAASGVGSFTVQLARELGARVIVAGRSLERLEKLRPLGASGCVLLSDELPRIVRELNDRQGVDLIFDLAGGSGFGRRLKALRSSGRCVLVGILAGAGTEVDLADVLRRRLRVVGSVLRPRSREEKARLVADFMTFAGPRLEDGRLRPVVDRIYPFARIADAYEQMQLGGVLGKLVLEVEPRG